jgi:hypothetical protein
VSESALPEELQPEEQFTRFIRNKDHFAATKGRIKPPAVMPAFNKASDRFETSTFRTGALPVSAIWQLGYAQLESAGQSGRIKARAIGSFSLVRAPLSLHVNGPPYPRHVDIIGWPAEKHAQMQHAARIADQLILEIDPRSLQT